MQEDSLSHWSKFVNKSFDELTIIDKFLIVSTMLVQRKGRYIV